MALRLDLNKFQAIKQAYLEYVKTGKCSMGMLQNFAAYKPYLEADVDIQNIKKEIKSKEAAEIRRIEEQKKEKLKRLEEERRVKNAAKQAAREKAREAKAARESAKAAEKRRKDYLKRRQNIFGKDTDRYKPYSRELTVYSEPAKIIYIPMGGQNKRY